MSVFLEKHATTGKARYRVHIEWRHPDGRLEVVRRISPINTKKGAEQHERDIRNALADGSFGKRKANSSPTLEAFRERYFGEHVAKLKPSSRSAQETIWRVSLLPTLGDTLLERVDLEAISKLTRALRERGAKEKTINNALSALRTALTHAEEWKLIAAVPRFRWLKVPQQKFDFFTFEEAEKLVAVGHPMVTTALKTGMRIGELLALKWGDLSLERKTVTVERSVFWEDEKAHEGGTKTGKVRALRLTGQVIAALEQLRPNRKLRLGYVFTDAKGEQLTRNECKWPLWRTETKAGVRRTGWHVCRHTFASHLVMKGVPIASVQQLMGHTTIAMTMKYAHLAPDHLRSAMDVLEEPGVTGGDSESEDENED